MWVACLAATGMSVGDMREYVANGKLGAAAAGGQIELLAAQEKRLGEEAERIGLRQQYVRLKIHYWQAVKADDTARAESVSDRARALADQLRQGNKQ